MPEPSGATAIAGAETAVPARDGRHRSLAAENLVDRTPAERGQYGLSAAIFTRSLESARRFTDEAQAGSSTSTPLPPAPRSTFPSAGSRGSGWGPHEQGRAALEFYTESVTVYEDI